MIVDNASVKLPQLKVTYENKYNSYTTIKIAIYMNMYAKIEKNKTQKTTLQWNLNPTTICMGYYEAETILSFVSNNSI